MVDEERVQENYEVSLTTSWEESESSNDGEISDLDEILDEEKDGAEQRTQSWITRLREFTRESDKEMQILTNFPHTIMNCISTLLILGILMITIEPYGQFGFLCYLGGRPGQI